MSGCFSAWLKAAFSLSMIGRGVFDPAFYYLTKMPADIDPMETGTIVVMALLLWHTWALARHFNGELVALGGQF